MGTELAPINVDDFDRQLAVAGKLIKTGFLPKAIDTPEKAVAIAMTGRELGIGMMLALQEINVIQGKPAASAKLQLALARRTGQIENFACDDNGDTATCVVQRKGQAPVTCTFSNADAKAMGLIGKDNWNKQPGNMRRWRAVSANLRLTFPDAIGGLYTPEELAPDAVVDNDGRLLDALPPMRQEIRTEIKKPQPKAAVPVQKPQEAPKAIQQPPVASKPASEAPAQPDSQPSEAFIVMSVDRKSKKRPPKDGKPQDDAVWYSIRVTSDYRDVTGTTYSETMAATASQSMSEGFKVTATFEEKPNPKEPTKPYINFKSLEPIIGEDNDPVPF